MRILYFLFIGLFFCVPFFTLAQIDSSNIGLVEHTIWYSKDPFYEGDTVKIYTMLYNSSPHEVSGIVEFYDKKVVLGKKDIVISPESAKDIFISWEVTAGEHSISARFLNPSKLVSGQQESIVVTQSESTARTIFVPKKLLSESKEIDSSENEVLSSGDAVVDKVAGTINEYVPVPISASVSAFDNFREEKADSFTQSKIESKVFVESLKNGEEGENTVDSLSNISKGSMDSLEKPLAYISVFFWTLLSFIFSHKIIFYGLFILVIFLLIRFIWKRFRN